MLFGGRIKQIFSQVLDWQPLREQNVCLCVNFSKYPLHISVQSSQFQNKLYDCDGTYKENTLEEKKWRKRLERHRLCYSQSNPSVAF